MEVEKKARIMIEEYRALRAEVQQTMANRNSILAFGFTTIGIVFHAGISILSGSTPLSAFSIFSVLLPILTLLIFFVWFGEVERQNRAAFYLKDFEDKINTIMGGGEKLLYWHHWTEEKSLPDKKKLTLGYSYYAVGFLLTSIYIFSLIFGIYYFCSVNIWIRIVIGVVMFGVLLSVWIWSYKRDNTSW